MGVRIRGVVLVNQAPVAAHLDCVVPLTPTQIIDDIVHWHAGDGGPRLGRRRRHEPESDVIALSDAALAEALSHISISDVIDDARGNGPGVADRKSLTVVFERRRGWLAWELLRAPSNVFLQVATNE